MSKYVCSKEKTYLCVETTYEKNDHIDKIDLKQMSKRVVEDLIISKSMLDLRTFRSYWF